MGRHQSGKIVFLSVMRCQVACAFRGVDTCDEIVCVRSMRTWSRGEGGSERQRRDRRVHSQPHQWHLWHKSSRPCVPSRRLVPGRSLRSRAENPGAVLLASWRDLEILQNHVTVYGSGSKVRCGGAWTETFQKQDQGFAVCAQEST